ncbi:DUF4921 family protein [Candidatus Parcubacteria bacterium]|nr:MAG: DUF4921 family protein [Candidatus Parcubacteria bacterium]
MPPNQPNISELRQDLVSGDWVVVATGRAKRPDMFARREAAPDGSKAECPFEELLPSAWAAYDAAGAPLGTPPSAHPNAAGAWWVQVVPNKFPAFTQHGECAVEHAVGPYAVQDGVGFHDVIITRDHDRALGRMSTAEAAAVIRSYRDRYQAIQGDECVKYIAIFHNHGREAGASIAHPHSQLIALPVIPPDISRSLVGSMAYWHRTARCVHCTMIAFEQEQKSRIVYENDHFLVICPFASRQAFEMRVFPKTHGARFEAIADGELPAAGDALRQALGRLDKGLNDPAYNFFIHTAPVSDGDLEKRYHWHIEILPKTAVWAGFEIGTGIEISSIAPESAAEFLRGVESAA